MTDFEKEIRDELMEHVNYSTWYEEDDEELREPDDTGFISDVSLCDGVTGNMPTGIFKKMQTCGLFTDLEHDGGAWARNISKNSNGTYVGADYLLGLLHYEAGLPMLRDNEYVGEIIIQLKYNTPEDCNDLIQYKFVPKDIDEDTIEFQVFHG